MGEFKKKGCNIYNERNKRTIERFKGKAFISPKRTSDLIFF